MKSTIVPGWWLVEDAGIDYRSGRVNLDSLVNGVFPTRDDAVDDWREYDKASQERMTFLQLNREGNIIKQ